MLFSGTCWIQLAFKVEEKWKHLVASPHSAPCWPGVPPLGAQALSGVSSLPGREGPPEDIDDGNCSQEKQLTAKQEEGPKEGAGCCGTW